MEGCSKAGEVESCTRGRLTTDQGGVRGTKEPSGSSGMIGHSGAEGTWSQGGADGSEGQGGVWWSVAGGRDRGSSCQGRAGDWKA